MEPINKKYELNKKYVEVIKDFLIMGYYYGTSSLGISSKQINMLWFIILNDIQTTKELREFYVNSTKERINSDFKYFVIKHLNKLEDENLVIKTSLKGDKRTKVIKVTEKGYSLVEKYLKDVTLFIDKLKNNKKGKNDRN